MERIYIEMLVFALAAVIYTAAVAIAYVVYPVEMGYVMCSIDNSFWNVVAYMFTSCFAGGISFACILRPYFEKDKNGNVYVKENVIEDNLIEIIMTLTLSSVICTVMFAMMYVYVVTVWGEYTICPVDNPLFVIMSYSFISFLGGGYTFALAIEFDIKKITKEASM